MCPKSRTEPDHYPPEPRACIASLKQWLKLALEGDNVAGSACFCWNFRVHALEHYIFTFQPINPVYVTRDRSAVTSLLKAAFSARLLKETRERWAKAFWINYRFYQWELQNFCEWTYRIYGHTRPSIVWWGIAPKGLKTVKKYYFLMVN